MYGTRPLYGPRLVRKFSTHEPETSRSAQRAPHEPAIVSQLRAAVRFAQGRPRSATVLLGTAHATRRSASKHMRPLPLPDKDLHRSLVQDLGAAAFDSAHREGERLSTAEALRFGRFDEPEDSISART
jgi:hypothetical protein